MDSSDSSIEEITQIFRSDVTGIHELENDTTVALVDLEPEDDTSDHGNDTTLALGESRLPPGKAAGRTSPRVPASRPGGDPPHCLSATGGGCLKGKSGGGEDGGGCCGKDIAADCVADDIPAAAPTQREFTMVGVKVQFPVKPYPSQMAIMAQILRGLQREQNCLLESPTGSGKSLALLCSTLAWQQQNSERARHYNSLLEQGFEDPELVERLSGVKPIFHKSSIPTPSTRPIPTPPAHSTSTTHAPISYPPRPLPHSSSDGSSGLPGEHVGGLTSASSRTGAVGGTPPLAGTPLPGGFIVDDDDDVFKVPPSQPSMEGLVGLPLAPFLDDTAPIPGGFGPTLGLPPTTRPDRPVMKRKAISRIYYGSRTHKQIAQVIRELKRTAYADARTAVLGSREHYCIHPIVSTNPNKNEGCRELRDPKTHDSCRFYHAASRIKNHDHLRSFLGVSGAHDLEELVTAGRRGHACPYYLARQLAMETADIVFCPYNYLVDPLIRDAMSINLRHHVVVLDEAHNIEDCSRDAASCTLLLDDLLEAMKDIESIKNKSDKEAQCNALALFLSILTTWIEKNSRTLEESFEASRNSSIRTGSQMIAILDELLIGRKQWTDIKTCLTELSEEAGPDDDYDFPKPKSGTVMLLKNIFLMYHFLYTRPLPDADDYRVVLAMTQGKKPTFSPIKPGKWQNRRRGSQKIRWNVTLQFMCLNPGVAFKEVGQAARNVILTSGTLSPMASFQSELEVPFQIQLEANHVIDPKQVWVGTVSSGPQGVPLQATFQNTESPQFQDELGRVTLSVCHAVPRGVLCFLPSYALLDKLLLRWQSTGMWRALSEIKVPMVEPRRSEEFEKTIESFYEIIRNTSDPELCSEGANGAFLMAVCRGKVSEGLDFTDDNARAVIAVGIPFPNVKDSQIALKREYNNKHCRTRGLLSGGDWYEIQAYRALNQALGRCLRHRYDWGALLLVDARYQQGASSLSGQPQVNKYIKGLSKWVRNMVQHRPNFKDALLELTLFAEHMTKNPPTIPPPDSPCKRASPLPATGSAQLCQTNNTFTESADRIGTATEPLLTAGKGSVTGPITSTQMDASLSIPQKPGNDLQLPELSQITTPGDDIRVAAATDSPRFATALQLQNGTAPTGCSTPSTKLAAMFSKRCLTRTPTSASPAPSAAGVDKKRKFEESPNKLNDVKRDRSYAITSTFATTPPSPRKFNFLSDEKIKSLSPIKSSLVPGNNILPTQSVATDETLLVMPTRSSSPDLFCSGGDSSFDSEMPPNDDRSDAVMAAPGRGRVGTANRRELRNGSHSMETPSAPGPSRLRGLSVLPSTLQDDSSASDLDDFDLDKSIRRSPDIRRRVSSTARRRRGVVFTKYD